ncbi:MAG: TIGR03618 family F420-dependent PPOX class oxidoreductase [Chloroflexi bacterium]|nr:TIGR03618 family F420-dependent PPOX class oxidoreductase [Chloroflexota bacterium]
MSATPSREDLSRLSDFLAPTKIAVVATVGQDGMPQLTPNWYVYQDGRIAISTTKQRLKYRHLMRDSRLAVCVLTEPLAQEYVSVRGTAEIIDDESIWPVTEAIVRRYVRPERVQARMDQLRTEDRIIISLKPERAHFR